MRRMARSARRLRTHRARPVIEGLEGRQLLSGGASHAPAAQPSASTGGVLSAKGQVFRYVTASGGIATIRIVGVGSLAGTSVDGSGALDLVYGGTNAYSKITGQVRGGDGRATLGSILNLQLIDAGQPDSLSGVGGTPVASVLMNSFDLEPGGTIILTPGVTSVVLHSIGANTNVQLRTLPPAPSYRVLPANAGNTAGGASGLFGQLATSTSSTTTTSSAFTPTTTTSPTNTTSGVPTSGVSPTETIVGTTIIPIVTGNTSLASFGSTGASSTLEAGQSASITTAQGVTLSYVSDGGSDQVLTNVSGSFTAQPNLLEPLAPGQALTEPPAPPGIILKVNSIGGSGKTVNPLTDSKIFGYDPTTGQVIRFNLNLQSDRGTVDPTFAPISVPGAPTNSDIDIAHDGAQLVLLATSGNTVYAYNADTGALVGSFNAAVPVSFVASAGNITVLGSTAINQIHMINLPASLQTGTAKGLDSALPFVPQPEVTLLGGLTGLAGSNNLYATVAAHFSTLQPDQFQLGIDSIGTLAVNASPRGSSVSNQFSLISRTGLVSNGNYETVQTNPVPPTQVGSALGAVDQNLALDTGVFGGNNVIKLLSPSSLSTQGTIALDYPDLLSGLSESFRTDLGGTALIDIQGDVQSVRGNSVNGMFLNDTGNLATFKIQRVDNSTVVGQPISHIQVPRRYNATFLTSSREVGNRNGAMQVLNIKPIGPTGLQGDS
jgi:hypothetical protein